MARMNETTVSGNIGKFRGGQVLKRREEIAEYFRLILFEGAVDSTNKQFTDDQILEVADRYADEQDDEDREMFIIQELEGIST